jgi:hypothetical protein
VTKRRICESAIPGNQVVFILRRVSIANYALSGGRHIRAILRAVLSNRAVSSGNGFFGARVLLIANGVFRSAEAALPIANGVFGSAEAALPIANGVFNRRRRIGYVQLPLVEKS